MKKRAMIWLFCLLSLFLVQTRVQAIELSLLQMSVLENLNLSNEKLESQGLDVKDGLVQALSTEIANRSTSPTDLPASLAYWSYSYPSYLVVVPISEGWSYIDGARCHVANYAEFSMITVFEGINQGCQLTVDYYGHVLFVNAHYKMQLVPAGVIYEHTYDNAIVVTGLNQVMYAF
ncbi:hypothetical protein PNK_0307 [Candidatus Protochlamydia naegleriophila]|uniref:Uncharacterized protein n=1 Tax=Candidatus Protochlamydia naegleriophila TaxID=389348 RepID=A0A0U5J844_9BACT|nr:hypothetical protein [Candidatus Protochlamydia naegleriophila]CUI15944.1 hypothetical protein PNK_0307 [Candidatus Protochlamydia naegleriophila]